MSERIEKTTSHGESLMIKDVFAVAFREIKVVR